MATAREIVKAHYDKLNAQTVEGCRLEHVIAAADEEMEKQEALRKASEVPDSVRKRFEFELSALCERYNIIIEHCDESSLDIRYARKG